MPSERELDADAEGLPGAARDVAADGQAEAGEQDGFALITMELETALRRRTPPRWRALSTTLVSIILVAIVFGVLRNAGARYPSSSSAPNSPSPGHPLLITANVTRGTVTLNGRRVGSPPVIVSTSVLGAGPNVITLSAPPFAPQSCAIDGPIDLSSASNATITGTCYLDIGATPAAVVGFTETGANLPPDLRLDALEAVRQALSGTAPVLTVPPGQYYAAGTDAQGHIISRRAGPALMGVVVVQPRDVPSLGLMAPSDLCAGFGCPAAAPDATRPGHAPSASTAQVWSIGEGTQATWSFVDQSGWPHLVGGATYPIETPLSLTLAYSASGTWRVLTPPGQDLTNAVDLCGSGAALLEQNTRWTGYGVEQLAHGATSLTGCVLDLVASDRSEHGRFVWRFGVLLAADARAHATLPFLPLAPAAEIAAAGGHTLAG
jgi:hypothetical protein